MNPTFDLRFHKRLRVLVLMTALFAVASLPRLWSYEERLDISRYDHLFREYAGRYFGPDFDWRIFKAQAVVESRLEPDAVSEDGAIGIMQLLPDTFKQVKAENPNISGNIQAPRWNIAAGIYYDRILWKLWEADRSHEERLRFMLGAYNAGRNAVLEAQQLAIDNRVNPFVWESVAPFLEKVIGPGYRETTAYVALVFQVRKNMAANGQTAHRQSF